MNKIDTQTIRNWDDENIEDNAMDFTRKSSLLMPLLKDDGWQSWEISQTSSVTIEPLNTDLSLITTLRELNRSHLTLCETVNLISSRIKDLEKQLQRKEKPHLSR